MLSVSVHLPLVLTDNTHVAINIDQNINITIMTLLITFTSLQFKSPINVELHMH